MADKNNYKKRSLPVTQLKASYVFMLFIGKSQAGDIYLNWLRWVYFGYGQGMRLLSLTCCERQGARVASNGQLNQAIDTLFC